MRRSALCVLAAVLSLSLVGVAQSNTPGYKLKLRTFSELANEQRRIVLGYCRADFEGARLVPDNFVKVRPFVSYRTNPEFVSFEVVSRFDVPLPEQPGDSISANYRVVGRWDNHAGWESQLTSESVQFTIIEREGDLLINEVEPDQPRVSARAALAYLRQQLPSAASDIERGMMQKGIDALSAMTASPVNPNSSNAAKP